MAQSLVELTSLLAASHAGDLSAQIFAYLAKHGRLTLPSLAAHADVPARRARTALSSLVETGLVQYTAAEGTAPAFYTASWAAAYNIARHSNVVRLVTERHGIQAGGVVKNILSLGYARVGELAEAYGLEPGSKRDSGVESGNTVVGIKGTVNGATHHKVSGSQHVNSEAELHVILVTLLQSGILVKIGRRTFVPVSDLQDQVEEAVISDQFPDRKVTGPKKQAAFSIAVRQLKRKWQVEDAFSETHDLNSKGTIKRPGQHFTAPNKRVKLNGAVTNGNHATEDDSSVKLSSELTVRVDFTRCTIGLRSLRLQNTAKRLLGPITSAVYGALLHSVEAKIRILHTEVNELQDEDDDPDDFLPVAHIREIAEYLDPDIELAEALGSEEDKGKHVQNGPSTAKRKGQVNGHQEGEDHPGEELGRIANGFSSYRDSAKRFEHIEAHLRLLEEHSKTFCKYTRPGKTPKGWRVPFAALSKSLLDEELDATVAARYGKVPLRLARLLRDRGKLEEKAVAAIAMMRIKDVRSVMGEMQHQGLVDVQEVPKEGQRQPSKNLYLWYFDTQRVQALVLQQTYKAMARTLQRVQVEKEDYRAIIEKAERSDIRGQESEKLEQSERVQLRKWREIEERLLTQVARLDDVVSVLRDFSGTDITMGN
ncbi:hypothetical protein LTR62_004689 [Meristemomyces frigidus]|uniref:DNA-directed RNA polymerase III subunit RPC3 n=1 Tax=Meristemomyces frigidus TaxID=1508187 RepID=A0AAN7YNY8_9PEZI|nr:hypothetical protein LTR62_004689 [Meristemomyces frigidus]